MGLKKLVMGNLFELLVQQKMTQQLLDYSTSVFRFGVPVFLAQRFTGFFTGGCRTKKLAMETPGIGNENLFAAKATSMMAFHIKHHRKPLCWHN